ncbi:amidohydrolase [bacterium]|nr:amidohydrolase [bacterium]NUN44394.1 amidohydrolase family protein [bacterium]
MRLITWILLFICFVFSDSIAQTLTFEEYEPPSTLVVPENFRYQSKYPFIDVHNHQFEMPTQDLKYLTKQMDSLNMAVMVNLSGRGFKREQNKDGSFRFGLQDGSYLKGAIENARKNVPGRLMVFTNVNFGGIDEPTWSAEAVRQLEEDVKNGACGLKIYKNLGMTFKDSSGNIIAVDDPRIDPIWKKAGELGIPVLIHSADPFQFWQPWDKNNERWLELKERPDRKRDSSKEPSFESIIAAQHRVFKKHPKTIFINAHLGWMGNDLAKFGKLMDSLPNMYTEIGAVLAEIGRQPRQAREWFIKYQDRVLFGKDSWNPQEYSTYFRVLETNDEYFDYYRRRHAYWKMYGLGLPDDVLKKLYYKNALRIIPGIDKSLFPK